MIEITGCGAAFIGLKVLAFVHAARYHVSAVGTTIIKGKCGSSVCTIGHSAGKAGAHFEKVRNNINSGCDQTIDTFQAVMVLMLQSTSLFQVLMSISFGM